MFDHKYYVPITRWKLGERIALRELLESDRQAIVPLIEISHDFVHKRPEFFNTSRFINKMLPDIASCWGNGFASVYLHALAELSSRDVTKHFETFFLYGTRFGLKLCPVVTL